jgi:hypothetical protein
VSSIRASTYKVETELAAAEAVYHHLGFACLRGGAPGAAMEAWIRSGQRCQSPPDRSCAFASAMLNQVSAILDVLRRRAILSGVARAWWSPPRARMPYTMRQPTDRCALHPHHQQGVCGPPSQFEEHPANVLFGIHTEGDRNSPSHLRRLNRSSRTCWKYFASASLRRLRQPVHVR